MQLDTACCDLGDIITDEKGTEWVVNLLNGTKQLCRMSDYDEFHIKEYFIESQSETIIYKPDKPDKYCEPDIQSKNKKIKALKH
jgi:hypothetical protein